MGTAKMRGSPTSGRRRRRPLPLYSSFESLEIRRLLDATIVSGPKLIVDPASDELAFDNSFPDSHTLWNETGTLTQSTNAKPLDSALGYIKTHASGLGLTSGDLNSPIVTDQYT